MTERTLRRPRVDHRSMLDEDDIIRRAQKDDFAAKAMQAMVSNGGSLAGDGGTASRAYGMADAMLKAREE